MSKPSTRVFDVLKINIRGVPYMLSPFKYHVKCLYQICAKFAALDPADREALQPVLEHTDCWPYLSEKYVR